MNEDLDADIQALFAQQHEELPEAEFLPELMHKAERINRWLIFRRLAFVAFVAFTAIPLQDAAIEFARVLMIQVVSLEGGLVASLLAPINSVGMLLYVGLFAMRAVHKRLFVRA